MTLHKIATVTEKSTGYKYYCYSVPSESDPAKSYAVGVRNGYACRCSCKDKRHHPSKRCKHILKLQAELDEQRRTAPLHREVFSMLR